MPYLLVPVAVVAAVLAVLYALYRVTPAARWRYRVVAHLAALRARQTILVAETGRADAAIARLEADALTRHLRTIPTDRLADYPGIGPATVEKVKTAAGLRIADVLDLKFEELRDVGEVRAAALARALLAVKKDAQARFAAGGCPEAQEFRRAADALRAADAARAEERGRELAAVETALTEAFALFAVAQPVNFLAFLRRMDQSKQLAEVIARPFPVVVVAPPPTPAPRPAAPVPVAAPSPPPAAAVTPLAVPVQLAAQKAPPADLFHAALTTAPAPPAPPKVTEPAGLARLRALAGFGLMVAKADGRIAQAERKAVRAYLDESFGHDPTLARSIDPVLEQTDKAVPTEGDALYAVRAAVPADSWPALVRFAERVAGSSGEPNAKEREALARIAAALGVAAPAPPHLPKPPEPAPTPAAPPPAVDHRAVLDIAPDMPLDPDLIRRRFQNLTDKLDPAKAAAFGPEFARMAEQKRAAVRAAAEALIAPFGEPLEKPAPPPPGDIRENALLDDVFG